MMKAGKTLKPEQVQFIKRLPWERVNPETWAAMKVPGVTMEKVRAIFAEWGIGWYADRTLCKGEERNIYVFQIQWARFDISPVD